MGMTSQVSNCDRSTRGFNVMVTLCRRHVLTRVPLRLFLGTHGQIGERLRHRHIPYVPTGHMGDIPCLWWG
jgi:hypothetical protein